MKNETPMFSYDDDSGRKYEKLFIIFSANILSSYGVSTAFQSIHNLSDSSWVAAVRHFKIANSFLICAGYCQFQQSKTGECNAFKYDSSTKECDLAVLTFLEDPAPGQQ